MTSVHVQMLCVKICKTSIMKTTSQNHIESTSLFICTAYIRDCRFKDGAYHANYAFGIEREGSLCTPTASPVNDLASHARKFSFFPVMTIENGYIERWFYCD